MNEVHRHSRGTYGSPRVHAVLLREDVRCGRRRVARLIRAAGLHGIRHRRKHRTTVPDPRAGARPDLIGRDFAPGTATPGTRWCGDITYIPTDEGWLYLATVIDIATRRVIGWATADHLRTELVAEALKAACRQRRPAGEAVFHSDRGCQGGFNRSSQHLDREVKRWASWNGSSGCAYTAGRSRRRAGRRWPGVRTGSGSGRRSLAGTRPRMRARPRTCPARWGSVGFGTLVA
ncbi:DDE-type integrase/transposase/recombinase [Streptomyces sp. NPDC001407]|uniref:DDE-type integrase/transposase/recombinase n=1 Tax=Streptomyces sp. NPDC001407 TaxID=3364573 RepID=UPI0036944114